jgi:hypothetical protein
MVELSEEKLAELLDKFRQTERTKSIALTQDEMLVVREILIRHVAIWRLFISYHKEIHQTAVSRRRSNAFFDLLSVTQGKLKLLTWLLILILAATNDSLTGDLLQWIIQTIP